MSADEYSAIKSAIGAYVCNTNPLSPKKPRRTIRIRPVPHGPIKKRLSVDFHKRQTTEAKYARPILAAGLFERFHCPGDKRFSSCLQQLPSRACRRVGNHNGLSPENPLVLTACDKLDTR